MITGLIVFGLALAGATAALADPFLRCTFGEIREIVLATSRDGIEWREDGATFPARILTDREEDPFATVVAYLGERGAQMLSIFRHAGPIVPGSAMLITPRIGGDARPAITTIRGTCEETTG